MKGKEGKEARPAAWRNAEFGEKKKQFCRQGKEGARAGAVMGFLKGAP